MERPEKKEQAHNMDIFKNFKDGYNQAIDAYEKFLPNAEEIEEIIYSLKNNRSELPPDSVVAEAIHNRIHKGGG